MDPHKPVALHLDSKVTGQLPLVTWSQTSPETVSCTETCHGHAALKPIPQAHVSARSGLGARGLCQGVGGTPGFVLERNGTIYK